MARILCINSHTNHCLLCVPCLCPKYLHFQLCGRAHQSHGCAWTFNLLAPPCYPWAFWRPPKPNPLLPLAFVAGADAANATAVPHTCRHTGQSLGCGELLPLILYRYPPPTPSNSSASNPPTASNKADKCSRHPSSPPSQRRLGLWMNRAELKVAVW